MSRLRPPAVSPDVYDEDYYRHACGPYASWDEHEGREIHSYYRGMLAAVDFKAGERLVDFGAGRGELLAAAIQDGAASAIGIEYSETAVGMAQKTLREQGVEGRAEIRHGDIRASGIPGESADLVTLLDVAEHMTPQEVHEALVEAKRIIAPGGRVVIHTMPNRLTYDVTYRLQRLSRPGRIRRWPRDPRLEFERAMHVNEFTLGSLRRAVKAVGFDSVEAYRGRWIRDDFVPDERAKRLYHRLGKLKPTAGLAITDLWARAEKRASG